MTIRRLIQYLIVTLLFGHIVYAELALESYPRKERIVLGTLPISLKPVREFSVNASVSGQLEIEVNQLSGWAEEGTLLANLDRERIELEGELLELETTFIELQELPEKRLAAYNDLRNAEARKSEIEKQLAFIEKIEASPELSKLYGRDRTDFDDTKSKATARLAEEMETVEEVLGNLEVPEVRALSEQILALKLKKRIAEHERRVEESLLKMPFDGRFQYLFPIEAERSNYRVLQGEPLLKFEDLSTIYGVIEVRGVLWRTYRKEQLRLRLPELGSRSFDLLGSFHHSIAEERGQRSALLYYFAFDTKAAKVVADIRGGFVSGQILLDVSEERPYLVPKLDLLEAYPNSFRGNWKTGVQSVFGEVKAVYIGQDEIGIVPASI